MSRRDRLGVFARLPRALTASPRARRLLFVAALTPGVGLGALGAPVRRDPALLMVGACLIALAVAARRVSEPRFQALEAAQGPDTPGLFREIP